MTLTTGSPLGPYTILCAIGAGGMGEVYKAHDAKLNRDVALKILPDLFAADPGRLIRFEREARTLAALNHPHIAQIYGFEERALVMEFVDGEDLAQIVTRGPIPIDETIGIARQIAEALEAAHEQRIIHRDLKPANVMVRRDGAVKVLDFGLAKAMTAEGDDAGAVNLANSPTFTSPMTQLGVILGTAAYMSPEQARGKPIDKRADIWAFGCIVFEMLAGRRPFAGETLSDTVAAILREEVNWTALPAETPASLRALLGRCLDKDPKSRLRDIGEARLALSQPTTAATPAAAASQPTRRPSSRAVLISGLLAIATMASAALLLRPAASASRPIVRFDVPAPAKMGLDLTYRPAVAVSADGSTIAFVGSADGGDQIYLRRRDQVEVRPLPGSAGGTGPVLSPDGRWVLFFADRQLKKASLDGGIVTLATSTDFRGAGWGDDGTIVYAPDAAGVLYEIPSERGTPRVVTKLESEERTHRWPQVLPGSKAAIFTIGSVSSPDNYDDARIAVVTLATGERHDVLKGARMARYVSSGHLLFVRADAVYAVPFDLTTLQTRGTPVLILQGVDGDITTGAVHLACADDGTLAYVPGSSQGGLHRIVFAARDGATQPLDLPDGPYHDVRLSPDGGKLAVLNGNSGSGDVWIYDLDRRTFSRLTFNGRNAAPVWSADGRSVYYTVFDPSGRKSTVLRKPVDGSREDEPVIEIEARAFLHAVTPDGRVAFLDYLNPGSDMSDVMTLPLQKGATAGRIAATRADEYGGELSPDRRWVAYHSDETGRFEVYVRAVDGTGARYQISTSGGEEPHWSADGGELYYRRETRLMAVAIKTAPSLQASTPTMLFDGLFNLRSDSGISYDVDSKRKRFVMLRRADGGHSATGVRVVLSWLDEVRRSLK